MKICTIILWKVGRSCECVCAVVNHAYERNEYVKCDVNVQWILATPTATATIVLKIWLQTKQMVSFHILFVVCCLCCCWYYCCLSNKKETTTANTRVSYRCGLCLVRHKNQDVEFLGWTLRNALHFGRAVMNGQMQIITALQTLYYNNQLIPFLCISCDQSLVQFGLDATFVGKLKLLCPYTAYCNFKMSFIACMIFSCREREKKIFIRNLNYLFFNTEQRTK